MKYSQQAAAIIESFLRGNIDLGVLIDRLESIYRNSLEDWTEENRRSFWAIWISLEEIRAIVLDQPEKRDQFEQDIALELHNMSNLLQRMDPGL